jgi:hypothetical protein
VPNGVETKKDSYILWPKGPIKKIKITAMDGAISR